MKQMTTYEQCIKIGAMLNPPLHWINDHKKDMEHGLMEERTIWRILENF